MWTMGRCAFTGVSCIGLNKDMVILTFLSFFNVWCINVILNLVMIFFFSLTHKLLLKIKKFSPIISEFKLKTDCNKNY